MKRLIYGLLCLLSVILLFTNCRKKAFDEFYGRPENLADPIYQQLQSRGNFNSLLKIIDKSGYKQTLSAAGSWTFFAANDDAFQKFIDDEGTSIGITSVDDISAELAEKIVRYSMAYDGEKSDRLSDYFSRAGFIENQSFRRRTLYYDFVYDGKNKSNENIKAIAYNRNGPTAFVSSDFNNKNIPVFLDAFMQAKGLGSVDYQSFYPSSTYSGFNVGPASVIADGKDIVAENGIIHIVDKVLVPPPSIDQYISSGSDYSSFKNLLDKFVNYEINAEVTRKYNVLTGNTNSVFVKMYNGSLAFAPNNENYFKVDANDAQQDSYSIAAPTNAAVEQYSKAVLLKYFPAGTTLDQLAIIRGDIIQAFINSHLFTNALWPSKFSTTPTFLGERLKINLATEVLEKKALSNGFFYGVSKAQDANVFSTVYGKIFLDPKFSIMRAALDRYGFSAKLQNPSFKYMLIPISDELLKQFGYSYEPDAFPGDPIRFNGGADNTRLKRIVGSHVIDLNSRGEMPDLNGEGVLLTATNEPDNHEYIRFKANRLFSAGTLDSAYTPLNGTVVNTNSPSIGIDSISSGTNGPVVYSKGVLMYTETNVGRSIERFGTLPTDPYYNFFQYLKNSSLYTAATQTIAGVELGLSYTIFIPTNAQILQAVADGLLPRTGTATPAVPNFAPSDEGQKALVERFIRYHILNKTTVAADGHPLRKGLKETLLKNSLGDPVLVNITDNTTSVLKLKDGFGRVSNVISPRSSLLANRTVIHQIDSYLKYTF